MVYFFDFACSHLMLPRASTTRVIVFNVLASTPVDPVPAHCLKGLPETTESDLWDGVGLRDLGYNISYGEGQAIGNPHAYSTYKLGLLLYVSGILAVHLPFESDVVNRIWSMQNQTNGGIFTHIMPDGSSGASDTNTENTAMVILGTSLIVPEFDFPVLMLCISVLLCAMIIRRIKRRHADVGTLSRLLVLSSNSFLAESSFDAIHLNHVKQAIFLQGF